MRLLALGLLTLDAVQVVQQVPGPNEKTRSLASTLDFGGPAANAAATAAALSSQARLYSATGGGPASTIVTELLERAGVQLCQLSGQIADTPLSTVLVTESTGERAVVSSHGLAAGPQRLPDNDILCADVVLLDGHYLEAAIQAATAAKASGIPVVLDGGSWKPGLERLLPLVDVAIVSDDFVGDTSACGLVARTHGAEPIELGGLRLPVPAVKVVDTLGAGDVLHGAFAHYLGESLPLTAQSVEAALQQAARVASQSCQYFGARGWVPSSR